jgi:D-alanine-D-alanine ligase
LKKLRVGVLFGGRSGEHEVSLNSANSILNALDREKYEIVPIGITKQGSWLLGADPAKILAEGKFDGELIPATLVPDPNTNKLLSLSDGADLAEIDVIIPVLHGTYGEDGTVQGLFELANIPYVGAGVLGSATGMDKIVMKSVFAAAGLPQARYVGLLRKEWEQAQENVLMTVEQELGYPCFVKPANLGSSVGISKAHNREELTRAINVACEYDRRIVVEEFIDGREIEVGVLGNDEPKVSVLGEIVPCNEFYDYKAKYIDGDSALIIPAEISRAACEQIREIAAKAFRALDCAGLSRVDFFVTKAEGEIYINEVNTMPGFTKISMYPKLWEATGIPYSELLSKLIDLAIERHADKNRSKTTFDL